MRGSRSHLDTVDDEHLVPLVYVALIASVHPSILECLPCCLLVVQIPEGHVRTSDNELSLLTAPAPGTVRLPDADGDTGQEDAGGTRRADTHVDLREGDGGARLGHPVALSDVRVREHARDLVRELRGEWRGGRGDRLDGAEVEVLRGWVL